MQPPCKDCQDRVLGCHSTCEKYIAFDKSRKEISEKRKIAQEELYDIICASRNRKKKRR